MEDRGALSPASHSLLNVVFAENYELMITGTGFNNAKKKDEVICKFIFSENKSFSK